MSRITAEELRNITEHLLAINECMKQARETLSHGDYMKFLQVLVAEFSAEEELREMQVE